MAATGTEHVGGTDRARTIFIDATGLIYDCGTNAWFRASLPCHPSHYPGGEL